MIFYNIYATIRPGQLANLKAGITQVFDFAQTNEPAYAAFASIDETKNEVTFFNVFSDVQAMQTHYALIPTIPGFSQIVASMDIIRREIFGELTPELRAQTAGADLTYHKTILGMRNREIVPTES